MVSISDNKRVAKNTLFLYIRMLLIMGISIFTVRIILENLGVIDYGIYNVIGGLSASFIFFQSALTNATQRFLNFNIGNNNTKELGHIFNISLEVYAFIAILVLIVGVSFGTVFVSNKLSIPIAKHQAAIVVLYTTVFTFACSFVASVYEAVLISHENMKIYAYIGLFDAVSKIIVAYLIVIIPSNKLIIYAIFLAISSLIPKIVMMFYCRSHYNETKVEPYWNKDLFKSIFSFSGWNIYGTGVWMINQQGIAILLNIYFGPVVNAAQGIASQVTSIVNNFVTNFFTAVRPQIVKTYAAGEYNAFRNLIAFSSRFSSYLVWIFFLPIYLRIDYILSLWLKDVPEYTSIFIKWVLLFMLVDVLNGPLWSAIQAVGKLRKTILYGSSFFLLAFPISYLFLRLNFQAWIVYPILIVVRVIYLIIVFRILNNYISISGNIYFKTVIRPLSTVILITYGIMYPINHLFPENFISLVLISVISLVISMSTMLIFGLNKEEKNIIISKVKYVIIKNKKSN